MGAIASTDVTVTVVKQQILRGSPGAQRRNLCKLVFGDGAVTYSTGVPLPAKEKFGLGHHRDYITPVDMSSGDTFVWKIDYANSKLRRYGVIATQVAMAESATDATVPATTIYVEAIGY